MGEQLPRMGEGGESDSSSTWLLPTGPRQSEAAARDWLDPARLGLLDDDEEGGLRGGSWRGVRYGLPAGDEE